LATTAKNITQIAAGYYHSLALSSEGKVFAWGKNDVGQLGIIDSNPFSLLPVTVAIPGKILISQISTTSTFSVALGINNVIYGWGNNSNGVLNMSSEQVSFNVPIVIYNNTKQVKTVIALAETIVVLFFDGDVYTFGKSNINGALGRFNSTSLLVLQDIIEISASGYSNIARRSDGKILMWGLNDNNQFLYFSVNQIPAPVLSTMETDTRVFMGAFHAFYIRKNEMFVTAAGANEFGQRVRVT
jgi:alpha-tubulin suppressor-like RCC1 family protein